MKEIKLIVDGKEVKLTDEQIKVLGFDAEKNPFERCEFGEYYLYIVRNGSVCRAQETNNYLDEERFRIGNYFKCDYNTAIKRAKQEALNRLLRNFSEKNGWDDSFWEDESISKYRIVYYNKKYDVEYSYRLQIGAVYYLSKEIAQRAIDEIIIPFEKGELEVCKICEE